MARLRGLDQPDKAQVNRLHEELAKLSGQSALSDKSKECWKMDYDDDFSVLRSGVDKGSRVTNWIKLCIGILEWELWKKHKVCSLFFVSLYQVRVASGWDI